MNVLGIIPARYNSSRFPGKPLVDIQGKTMIERVYRQAVKAKLLNKVVIATDDERIFEHVQAFGGEVLMTSGKHVNGTERCAEVVEKLSGYNAIVNIQGDEPFIQPEQIDLLAEAFNDTSVQIATLIKQTNNLSLINSPNSAKVVFNANNEAMYFSRAVIPYTENQTGIYYKHIGMYGYRSDILPKLAQLKPTPLEQTERLEQLRWLEHGFSIKVLETEMETLSVDTPDDLNKINSNS